MTIAQKVRLINKPDSIEIRPYADSIQQLYILSAIIVIAGIISTLFRERLGHEVLTFLLILVVFSVGYILVELMFKTFVRLIFDGVENAVFRVSPLFGRKKLFALDELVFIKQSESGKWHYAIGVKKRHVLKNYRASPDFGSGKKGRRYAQAYENEIINSVKALQNT